MRRTIGDFDYIKNDNTVILVYQWDGVTDFFIARFTKADEILISEIKLNNPHAMELYNTATQIFNGEITL